jgi:hypothetical protein
VGCPQSLRQLLLKLKQKNKLESVLFLLIEANRGKRNKLKSVGLCVEIHLVLLHSVKVRPPSRPRLLVSTTPINCVVTFSLHAAMSMIIAIDVTKRSTLSVSYFLPTYQRFSVQNARPLNRPARHVPTLSVPPNSAEVTVILARFGVRRI